MQEREALIINYQTDMSRTIRLSKNVSKGNNWTKVSRKRLAWLHFCECLELYFAMFLEWLSEKRGDNGYTEIINVRSEAADVGIYSAMISDKTRGRI